MKFLKIIFVSFIIAALFSAANAVAFNFCGGTTPCNCSLPGTVIINESRTFTVSEDLTGCTGGINIGADDITLDCAGYNLTGSSSGAGLTINGYSNVTVKNCVIHSYATGMYIADSENDSIQDNEVYYNIALATGMHLLGVNNSEFLGNDVSFNDAGIILDNSYSNNFEGSLVLNNSCNGIYLSDSNYNTLTGGEVGNNNLGSSCNGGVSLSSSANNTVFGIFMHNNKKAAVYIYAGNNSTIDGCNIDDNCGGEAGVYVYGSDSVLIKNNNITDGTGYGIEASAYTNLQVTDNNITNNTYEGIYLDGGDVETHSMISGNYISKNGRNNSGAYYGIYILNDDYINLSDNDFVSNWNGGLYSDNSIVYLENGNFINNGESAYPAYGIYDSAVLSVHWTVTEPVECTNNTVYVGESVTGADNITLDNCPIYESGSCVYGCPSTDCSLLVEDDYTLDDNMYCSGSNGITVGADNVTLDCAGYTIYGPERYTGINIKANNVTVKNCEVLGFDNGILSGNYNYNNILNNTVRHIGVYGIAIRNAEGCVISDNTVKYADVGIRVVYSSGTEVSSNTVTDNIDGVGHGIDIAIESSYNTVTGNTIKSNLLGIVSTESENNTIKDNDVSYNCEGIQATSNSILNVINTDFTSNNDGAIDACGAPVASGLYVDSTSHVNLVNGNFENNGVYGILDGGGDSVEWTINQTVTCRNNNVSIANGWLSKLGGSMTAEDCTITVNGEEFNASSSQTSSFSGDLSIGAGENGTIGESDAGFETTVYSSTGYTGTMDAVTYDALPGGASGFSLEGLGTWIEFNATELASGDWAIIKIYYTDAGVAAAGLNESSLVIEYCNNTTGTCVWEIFSEANGNGGVDTAANYVWANTTHFSGFGIFGSSPVAQAVSPSLSGGAASIAPAYGTEINWTTDTLTTTMVVRDKILFTSNGNSHSAELISLGTDYAVLWFSSEQVSVTVAMSSTKQVDLDANGAADISVALDKIEFGKAALTFNRLAQPSQQTAAGEQPAEQSSATEGQAAAQGQAVTARTNYLLHIFAFIAFVAITSVVYYMLMRKRR
ncbi:MAG: right-handed parallel beta-helix repeat-containing protein [Candidatus Nanoarchaeia archaeon]|nr:right-handed parallel beta-helix repeat-containing protein [Candidatus Nanoarchaeia archaeon]MDD5239248.1 right-handed parallel beta-helix repeat-containing protein [Candidatus Nanoarchaeia archaeon]